MLLRGLHKLVQGGTDSILTYSGGLQIPVFFFLSAVDLFSRKVKYNSHHNVNYSALPTRHSIHIRCFMKSIVHFSFSLSPPPPLLSEGLKFSEGNLYVIGLSKVLAKM